ncbi:MAG: branched-chain amino acid ABC transporter [Neisseria sp.]|nr:branched-chain amino acid ABC transporter [Neisseria sp.]
MNQPYQRALQQIDALMAHFRSEGEVSCAVAEQEDSILIRLNDLKHALKPEDTDAINQINLYHQRHIKP